VVSSNLSTRGGPGEEYESKNGMDKREFSSGEAGCPPSTVSSAVACGTLRRLNPYAIVKNIVIDLPH